MTPPAEEGGPIRVVVNKDLEDLIPGYLENRRRDIGRLQEALSQGDWERLRILGHSMAGSGGGYGFAEITTLGRQLERAAQARDASQVEARIRELASYLDRVRVETPPS
jgi:HPt (histidine-containing phosphotransfer) domain-containing protein